MVFSFLGGLVAAGELPVCSGQWALAPPGSRSPRRPQGAQRSRPRTSGTALITTGHHTDMEVNAVQTDSKDLVGSEMSSMC